MFSSLKSKLTMATCGLFLTLFVIQTAPTLIYFQQKSYDTLKIEQFQRTSSMAHKIDINLHQAHQAIIAVASIFPTHYLNDYEQAQRWIDDRTGIATIFDNGLFLFNNKGDLVVEKPFIDGRRGKNYSFRNYFIRTMQQSKSYISEPYVSSKTNNPAVMMTAPIYDDHNNIIAILCGSLNLMDDNLLGQLNKEKLGNDGYYFLVNTDRSIIMHPDYSLLLSQIVREGVNPLFDLAMNGFEGTDRSIDLDGIETLTSYKKLNAKQWILGATRPLSEVNASITQAKKVLWILMSVSTLIIMLTMLILLRKIMRPLIMFTQHIKTLEYNDTNRVFSYPHKNEIGTLVASFNTMIEQNDVAQKKLEILATRDPLTQLYNRRTFLEFAQEMIFQAQRHDNGLCLIMLDLDHFKLINDNHGHQAGDMVLKSVAETIEKTMRNADICGRYGGEEFCILLPETTRDGALIIAERIRSSIELCEINLPHLSKTEQIIIHVTTSVGVAQWQPDSTIEQLTHIADKALYQAKATGRNCVIDDLSIS